MNQYITIFLFLSLTFAWHYLVPRSVHDKVLPWAFAALMCNICCSTFLSGFFHAILGLLNYTLFAIICDGFSLEYRNQNPSWKAFMFFWAYMVASSLWGDYRVSGIAYWLNILFTSFCIGYSVALWLLRTPWGLRKLSLPMILLSFLAVVLYAKHGGLNQIEAGAGRAAFDAETLGEDIVFNENSIAIYMVMLLVFMEIAYMRTALSKKERILKFAALGVAVPLALILIRAGSRGGALCLLPMTLYFLFSTGNQTKRRTRIALFVVGVLVIAVGVSYTMKGAHSIRAFSLRGEDSEASYLTDADQLTTGRVSMWERNISMMTDIQMVFGRGLWTISDKTNRVTAGNAHCMYMTILYNSGYVGVALFLIVLCLIISESKRLGDRGRMAGVFFGIWMLHGVGESWGMIGGGTAILGGIGFGLLSRCQIRNPEFLGRYNPMVPMYFPDEMQKGPIEFDLYAMR